jgi:type IV pilus assembly protein PilV
MVNDRHQPVLSTRSKRSSGFSLIELLVAVLVMGIGVLGVTALQMVSLQNNRMALERGEAVHLAYDIMDRIRANPGVSYATDIGDAPPAAPNCVGLGANCSAAQMRDFDLTSWKCLLGEHRDDGACDAIPGLDAQPGLPNGDGAIEEAGAVVTVTVQWSGVGDADQTVVIDSQQ